MERSLHGKTVGIPPGTTEALESRLNLKPLTGRQKDFSQYPDDENTFVQTLYALEAMSVFAPQIVRLASGVYREIAFKNTKQPPKGIDMQNIIDLPQLSPFWFLRKRKNNDGFYQMEHDVALPSQYMLFHEEELPSAYNLWV